MGWDPAGQDLATAMPRYQMSPGDLADLTNYVKALVDGDTPGVSESVLRVALSLPDDPGASSLDEEAIRGPLDVANRSGGVYRRRLELVVHRPPIDPTRRRAAAGTFLDSANVLAVIGRLTPEDDPLSELAEARGIPVLGVYPPGLESVEGGSGTFALVSGDAGQARALFAHAERVRMIAGALAVVLHGPSPVSKGRAEELARRLAVAGARRVVTYPLPAPGGRPEGLDPGDGSTLVFVVGPVDSAVAEGWLRSTARLEGRITALVPASVGLRVLADPPARLAGRLLVAGPGSMASPSPGRRPSAGVSSLLVEALKGAGRGLDRDKFVSASREISGFETGVTPPVTFGPGRRVGARGASILGLAGGGRAWEVVEAWVDPGPGADESPGP